MRRAILRNTLLAAAFGALLGLATYTTHVYAGVLTASTTRPSTRTLLQNLTATAPSTTDNTEGVNIGAAKKCVVQAFAQAAATLTNLTLKAYYFDPEFARWSRLPSLDITYTAVGQRDFTSAAMDVSYLPGGRIEWVSAGTTVSAGTQITVGITCPK